MLILYISFLIKNSLYSDFCKANFCTLNISHYSTICDLSPFLALLPLSKELFESLHLYPFLESHIPTPTKIEIMWPEKGANHVTLQENNDLKR